MTNAPVTEIPYCDFCGSDEPRWRYSVEDYTALVTNTHVITNDGDWAACNACYELIEANDRANLAKRHPYATDSYGEQLVRRTHDGFFAHKLPRRAYKLQN